MENLNKPRKLAFLWLTFGLLSLALAILCILFLEGKSFLPQHQLGALKTSTDPKYKLITLLGGLLNLLFLITYNLKPTSKYVERLNVPYKKYWLSTLERRQVFINRLQKVFAALGAYINFLIASAFYMTLHYFYPRLPCPRHLLMMLIWVCLTIWVGIYAVSQFKLPKAWLKS